MLVADFPLNKVQILTGKVLMIFLVNFNQTFHVLDQTLNINCDCSTKS